MHVDLVEQEVDADGEHGEAAEEPRESALRAPDVLEISHVSVLRHPGGGCQPARSGKGKGKGEGKGSV